MVSRLGALAVFALLVGCGDDGSIGGDAGATPCSTNADCDDGLPCNGEEVCSEAFCVQGSPLLCDDGMACTRDRCIDSRGGCVHDPEDLDGDGAASTDCGGDDCDDTDPNRYPGNTEVCDALGRDEDCDPETVGERDADGDGSIDARCCNGERCGDDCDDMQPAAHPGEAEDCDTVDNDCDGAVDEGVLQPFYEDGDGDSYGLMSGEVLLACAPPPGYAEVAGDCDDADALANPGLPEVCDTDGRDDDCDGEANPDSRCSCTGSESRGCVDGDGELLVGVCAAGVERCEDGRWSACTIRPTNEVCDGRDDEDCDGSVDEGLTLGCWPDMDNDGFAADGSAPIDVCPGPAGGCPGGTTDTDPADEADCDDRVGARRPSAEERTGNGVDDDCDGAVDEETG
jgi:hypothetical protein